MIETDRISVVIQGAYRSKISCSDLVALYEVILPGAEIILSVWSNDLQNIPPDVRAKVVVNDDPGYFIQGDGFQSNINRQIVSSAAGVDCSTRDYILKTRFDIIPSSEFRDFCRLPLLATDGSKFVAEKIRTTNLFVRDPRFIRFLYHPSDVVMFGRAADMRKFWCGELAAPSEFFDEFEVGEHNGLKVVRGKGEFKLLPEQWLALRHSGVSVKSRVLPHRNYLSLRRMVESSSYIFNNFEVFDYRRSGLEFPSRFIEGRYNRESLLSEKRYQDYSKANVWTSAFDLGYLICFKVAYNSLLMFREVVKYCRRLLRFNF